MKVLIVGLNHQIQRAEVLSGGVDIEKLEREQKEQFGQSLTRLVQNSGAQFVGEEAEHGVELIANKVALHLNCRHANIEIPPDLRKARGIPVDYTRTDRAYTPEQRANWHREREEYMVDQVTKNAACDSAVILCGREHTGAMAHRFREAGHEVETYDLNQEGWYIEDWLTHILTS
jgi:hypothetical protein